MFCPEAAADSTFPNTWNTIVIAEILTQQGNKFPTYNVN
jgi:hypothetical protein